MHTIFSPEAEQRLSEWIGPATWHTGHPADDARFFRFARALWECNQRTIDEDEVREKILAQAMVHGDWQEQAARDHIQQARYANLIQNIMDYHVANGD